MSSHPHTPFIRIVVGTPHESQFGSVRFLRSSALLYDMHRAVRP
ncbi:hypothetical protein Ae406Ps2_6081 [Pseudonocardia sp. Ae406_Ps2]|nr:hypothetical protein Ae406Ps2_6081 [Pseudonocardia sp. Ae406_Ps2]